MNMFITLEGVEGSGKTTVAKRLIDQLTADEYDVLYTREPGGNKIAEQIRDVILNKENTAMADRTEVLLYAAARYQHLVDVITPALEAGKVVICDRFVDSSIAYQGHARGVGVDQVATINQFATKGLTPDLTLFIDVTPEVGLARINQDANREINRLDLEGLKFHQAVYKGYQALAKQHSDRIVIINGEQTPEEVINDAYETIKSRLTS